MQQITKENLICGKEYYLECFTHDEESNFVPHVPRYKMIARFEKLHEPNQEVVPGYTHAWFTNFRPIKYKKCKDYGYPVHLNEFWNFYEIIEDNVQRDMEKRAYNMILRQVIEDEYFTSEFI